MDLGKIQHLKKQANLCRQNIIQMLVESGSGHPGSSLSVIDILVYLFSERLQTQEPNRDRLILSKGHSVPALYAVLAAHGILPQEELKTLRKFGSRLQGHPDRLRCPWMDASTGSLGQGLSVAQGYALAQKLKNSSARIFCILGDGEIQEGQIWEAAMSIPKFGLNNLTAILDYNHGQIDGTVSEVMELEPLAEKWKSFRWNVVVTDGHDFSELDRAFSHAFDSSTPTIILANTVKGKGVSFMEHNVQWHGVAPNAEEGEKALAELRLEMEGFAI